MTPTTTHAQREPAITVGLVTSAVTAILALVVAFGVDLDPAQQVAILGVVAGVGPLIVAIITRGQSFASVVVAETVSPDGTRIAGPASPLPTGSVIADI